MAKKHNMVWVKIICGLGSSVSEKYTACVFRRLSEDGGIMLIKNNIHTICFGTCVTLKCHEMEGGRVWYGIVVLEVYPTPHSIEIKTCFSL